MRSWTLAMLLGPLVGCADACGTPEDILVIGQPPGEVTIDWHASNAMGLYFTELDAKIPGGPGEPVKGHVYWVVESTSFPGGFAAPVRYGEIPRDAKDATEAHGGAPGGEALTCGIPYKVAVVALGGSGEVLIEWECD